MRAHFRATALTLLVVLGGSTGTADDNLPEVLKEAGCLIKKLPLPHALVEATSAFDTISIKLSTKVHGQVIGREVLLMPYYGNSNWTMAMLTARQYRTRNILNGLTMVIDRYGEPEEVLRGPRKNPLMAKPNEKLAAMVDAVQGCMINNLDSYAVKTRLMKFSYQ